MTQPFEDSTLTLPDLHMHKSSIACATRLISTDIDFVCPGSTMPGGGWMQVFKVFKMLHMLPAFNAWASGVYCAKRPAHCEHYSVVAEARGEYQARQFSQCMAGENRQFVAHPNTDFSTHML